MKREMIAIYTLTSELHDEKAVGAVTQEFLSTLGIDYTLKGNDYAEMLRPAHSSPQYRLLGFGQTECRGYCGRMRR